VRLEMCIRDRSDRIAVMNFGRIEQVGEPYDLYYNPKNEFVANFLGISNIVELEAKEGRACLGDLCFEVGREGKGKIFFRPENVAVGEGIEAEVIGYELLPGRVRLRLSIEGREIIAEELLSRIGKKIPKKVRIRVREFKILP